MLNEDYTVELLKKLPVYHRRIYEYQQIAEVQTPELERLLVAIDFVLDNWFIETASEYGISRLEKIVGIAPLIGDDLETRRYRLLAKMTEKIPYTDETLEERLASICGGSEYYEIVRDYLNYRITINTNLNRVGSFDEVCNALVKMIPCNLVLEVYNILSSEVTMGLFYGISASVAMAHSITHDMNISDNLNMSLYGGVGLAKAGTHLITHDIHERENGTINLYSPTGVSIAEKTAVTHDTTFEENVTGNSIVGIPTTTATIITIN